MGSTDRMAVSSVALEKISPKTNAVRVTVPAEAEYKFSQTATSEYVLTIRNTVIGSDVAPSIIAEASAGQIRSVRPVSKGEDTLVRVFARPESTLVATRRGGSIVIEEGTSFSTEDVRAQAKPIEAEKPKAAPATEAGARKEVVVKDPAPAASGPDTEVAKFLDDAPKFSGRQISLDLQDTDIDNALRIIAEVSNLNIIASDDVTGKVTLRLIDVPWDQALDVILKTNGLDKVQEGNVVRIAPVEKLRAEREGLKQAQQAAEDLEPVTVKYYRVSYARASDMKPLIESVISERGQITFDDRTNQLIVRDVARGIKNVAQLIQKLDLRTPQVLLETQIVEARRGFLRNLGSQTGFRYVQSPETGNPTGKNFPNSVDVGGTVTNAVNSLGTGNPISFLFGSADGTKTLTEVLTAEEQDGRVKIISKPAVATLNNKPATIKSTVNVRIRLPTGGNAIATGQGAAASGAPQAATEKIETGITLTMTPQASPDYYVLLDIFAKSSNLDYSRTVDGIPQEIERATNSSVLISSGQTFAMGGVYKVSENHNVTGLPWFKDVPFFGHFFNSSKVDDSEEEILFFVTPRIVEGSFDDAAMRASL
jgi:type IV pilus assembly protein PilQ